MLTRLLSTFCLASMVVIQPVWAFAACNVYEHRDYKGASLWIGNGQRLLGIRDPNPAMPGYSSTTNDHSEWRILYRPDWNDRISSFRVGRGCTITVYEHIDFRGWKWAAREDMPWVGLPRNDKISDVTCTCR